MPPNLDLPNMKRPLILGLALSVFLCSQTHVCGAELPEPIKTNPLQPDYVLAPPTELEKKFSGFEFRTFEENCHVLPYRIYHPAHLEPGKKYPLVIFFHGAGERGLDNRLQLFRFGAVAKFWDKYPCFIVAPQCPPRIGNRDGDSTWVQTGFSDSNHTMKKQPSWPMDLAMKTLDKIIAENPVDTKRIYVTGLSMGGFATWEILQREPAKFAAAIPICGGGDPAFARKFANVPIWIFHGSIDETVQPKRSRDMTAALAAAGGHPVYTEYIGAGHDVWGQTYSDIKIWDWLFAQIRK